MNRPPLQVTHVALSSDSGPEARNDVVVVTLRLDRSMSNTRPIPYHTIDVDVFNAIGDWWDAQLDHDAVAELETTHGS